MRWRVLLGVVLALAAVVYVVVVYWPRGTAAASWYSIPKDAQPLVVREVLSGDVVVLVSDRPGSQVPAWGAVSMRLLGVNAPNFGLTNECYAIEAEGRLNELLPEGSIAWVTVDETPKDELGRWLAYVWTEDGRLVNELLAVDGFVRAEEMPPNDRLWSVISRAGNEAASRFGGLWGECR
jgi:endonuclease YncB( thermonuclease family)